MSFPLDNPIFRLFLWIVNTPGGGESLTAYFSLLYWIRRGVQVDEADEYAYPTPTLLGHGDQQ